MARYCEIDPVTGLFIVDRPDYVDGPENDTLKIAPNPNHGFILPRWIDASPPWIEGATQEQIDERAAFLADEGKSATALAILEPLLAGEKSILGGGAVEKVLYALGKALNKMSVSIETAAEDLETPGATAAEVRTSVITYATAVKTAQATYQADIARIRQAIQAREAA